MVAGSNNDNNYLVEFKGVHATLSTLVNNMVDNLTLLDLLTQNSNIMIRITRILFISVIFGGNTGDVHGCGTHDHSHKQKHRTDQEGAKHHDENREGHNLRRRLGIFDTNVTASVESSNSSAVKANEADMSFGCPVDSDTCDVDGGKNPIHSFMSYGDDNCVDQFTPGQKIKLQQAWETYRHKLGYSEQFSLAADEYSCLFSGVAFQVPTKTPTAKPVKAKSPKN